MTKGTGNMTKAWIMYLWSCFFWYLVSHNRSQRVLGLTQFSQGKCDMWIPGSATLAYQCLRQFSPTTLCYMSDWRVYPLLHTLDTCVLHGLPRVPTAVQPLSGRVKCLKPPRHPLFYCWCSSFWLGHLALVCQALKKQCSSCGWDGLGSAIYSPHLNPQLAGSCVLENWHITLQGAYCHP